MRRRKHIALAGVLAAVLTAAGYGYYFRHTCLPNFRTVRKHVLYRSGQPRGPGLHALRLWGIRTVINLRGADADGVKEEAAFTAEHGMSFRLITVGKTAEAVAESTALFLAVVTEEANWPVLVHCSRGKERAGVLSAVFRMGHDGWSNQQALYELYRNGLEPGSMPAAETFVWNFDPGSCGDAIVRDAVAGRPQEFAWED